MTISLSSIQRATALLGRSGRDEDFVVLKLLPEPSSCCCFHCWPKTWRQVNRHIAPQGPIEDEGDVLIHCQDDEFVLECHESGPEIVAYLGAATASLVLVKSVVDLVTVFLKALQKEPGKAHRRIKVVHRGVLKGQIEDEVLLEVDFPLSDEITTMLNAEIRQLLTRKSASIGKHKKRSVFLSHNKNDKAFVRRIHRELSKRSIRNWFDEAEMLPGDSLIEKIEQGITAIDYLAVFLSPDSVKSAWVKKEVSVALTREIAGHLVRVVPIMIGELRDSDIPAMLADKYYIDFRAPYPFEKGLSELHMLLDSAFADFISDMIGTLEEPDESALALEGVLRAAGHDVDGIAKLRRYHKTYKAFGIEFPDVFDMYESAPRGAADRLVEDIKRSVPYPLWRYLANPDMLRKILRGFGRDV